jgi:glycosyltransferase involved in cell wall biosynthesis
MLEVSIITPLLNRADALKDALASVAEQGPGVEHIVVDGGSTDGSQAVAATAGSRLLRCPGSSIYEAINIGLAHATGQLICLLNSDDRLESRAVEYMRAAFTSDPSLELVRGRAKIETRRGNLLESATPPISLRSVLLGVPNINACCINMSLIRRLGTFDTRYKISADRQWLARAMLLGARTAELDRPVYVYRSHPGSLTIGPDKPARRRWISEHLAWSRALLADDRISIEHRSALQAFYAKESAHLCAVDLIRWDLVAAARTMTSSFNADPLWPARALGPLAEIVFRRISSALDRMQV